MHDSEWWGIVPLQYGHKNKQTQTKYDKEQISTLNLLP